MSQDSQQSQGEQELQFKKRARRRLVGAIGLVLLMITILPLLLKDKTEQSVSKDILISIPSQDAQLNKQSIEEKHNQDNSGSLASTQPQDAAVPNPNSNDKPLEETKPAVSPTVESASTSSSK
jgi:DedD protein